jgi:DNA polymerase III epsilon subunit-like protein
MYLFMDTETGGLTPEHSLLTVSVIPVDKDFQIVPVDYYDPFFNQTTHTDSGIYVAIKSDTYVLDQEALAVNKIDIVEHDKTAVPIAVARELICGFAEHCRKLFGKKYLVPAGHNVAFDVKFLKAHVLSEQEWDRLFTYPALDTAAIARFLNAAGYIGGGYSLTSLRDKFLSDDFGVAHNAEVDNLTTIALAQKFTEMIQRRASA